MVKNRDVRLSNNTSVQAVSAYSDTTPDIFRLYSVWEEELGRVFILAPLQGHSFSLIILKNGTNPYTLMINNCTVHFFKIKIMYMIWEAHRRPLLQT